MLKYHCILLLTIWSAASTSIKATVLTSLDGFAPADSLVIIDTTSISDNVLVIREITYFKEIILDDTLRIGNELKIKKIIVEHTNISPIDTIYLGINIEEEDTETIDKVEQKPSEKESELLAESVLSETQYSSSYYFANEEDIEPNLIVAESTGIPIDVEESRKANRSNTLNSSHLIKSGEAMTVFTPASQAGLPGAKVLERRMITPKEAYDLTLTEIEKKRQFYARNLQKASTKIEKQEIIQTAAAYLEETIAVDVVHYWYGTSFDKEGMAKNPNEGKIACSYFITTVLEDAGLKVNRVKLAQQSAKNIAKTLCSPSKMRRLTTPSEAKNYVEKKR